MRAWSRTVCVWLIIAQIATPVWAGPLGGSVAAGQATIGGAGAVTEVRQSTDRAIVNWQSFSTAAHESVRFVQPSAASVTLNRVTGNAASSLNGGLTANGRVFISNPNGIHFGATSRVNVGSLVASTLAIANDDFMRGNHRFTATGQTPAAVVNDGHIETAPGGTVALVGPVVANHGTINAPGGRVTLAAGAGAQVDLEGGLVRLESSGAAPRDVVAGTDGSANPLAQAVNNGALVEAGGVVESNGRVILKSAEGLVVQGGAISARHVTLDSTQTSALTAGSLVRATDTAKVLSRGHAASLAGSTVEVPNGLIEVSGKRLSLKGRLDTRGDDGRAGRLLIDPANLVIRDASDGSPCTVGFLDEILPNLPFNQTVTLRACCSIEFQNTTPLCFLGANLTLEILAENGTIGTGNITFAGAPICGVNDFTLTVGEAARPATVGCVDLSGAAFGPFGGNVNINVFAGCNSVIRLPALIANGSISVSGSGAIEGTTGAILCACTITLGAPRIGTCASPIQVATSGVLSLFADSELFVVNQDVASDLAIQVQDVISGCLSVIQGPGGKVSLEGTGSGKIDFCYGCGRGSNLSFTLAGVSEDLEVDNGFAGDFNVDLHVADGQLTGCLDTSGELSLTSLGGCAFICVSNASEAQKLTIRVTEATNGTFSVCQSCTSVDYLCGNLSGTAGNLRLIAEGGDIALGVLASTGRVELEARGGDIRIISGGGTPATASEFVLTADGDILGQSGSNRIEACRITLDAGGTIGTDNRAVAMVAGCRATFTTRSGDGLFVFFDGLPQRLDITLGAADTPVQIEELNIEDVLVGGGGDPLRSACHGPCGLASLPCETTIRQETGDLSVGELLAQTLTLEATAGQLIVESGELIDATNLTLNANSGIVSTDASPVRIDVSELTVCSGSGTVRLQADNALTVVRAEVGGPGGLFDLKVLTGNICIGQGIFAETVQLATTDGGGSVNALSCATVLRAEDATIRVDRDATLGRTEVSDVLEIRSADPAATLRAILPVRPDRLELDFSVGATLEFKDGALTFVGTTAGALATPDQPDFDVDITARGGDFTVGLGGCVKPVGTAGGADFTVRAPDGALIVNDTTALSADDLRLQAARNIGTTTGGLAVVDASSLRVDSLTGDVNLAALGDISLRASTAGGAFTMTSSGDLRLTGDVTAGGALSLTVAGALTDTGGTDHVLAGSSLALFGRDLGRASRPLTFAAPTINLLATGDAFVRSRTATNAIALTAAGDLAVQGLADITVGSLAGATVQVQSFGGRVLDGNGAANNVTAIGGTAGFFAAAGIGTAADAIETNASALIARTLAGDISLTEFDFALVTASAPGDVRISSDSSWLVLNTITAGGRVELRAAAGGLIDANGAAVNVTASSLLVAVADVAGFVDDALEVAVGSLDATAFGVFVEATGALRVDQLTSTFTNRIRATGDVTLGRLSSTQGIVDVISVNGAIRDGNGAAANLVVTSGGDNRLIAGTTIGVGDALEVDVNFLTVAAGAAAGGVSAQIDGTINPANFVNVLEAPGVVLFNGRVEGTGAPVVADTPEAAQLRTADPAQSLGASFAAQGNPSAADAAGSSSEGPRDPNELIDSSAAND